MTKTLEEQMFEVLQVPVEENRFQSLSVDELEEIVKTAGIVNKAVKGMAKVVKGTAKDPIKGTLHHSARDIQLSLDKAKAVAPHIIKQYRNKALAAGGALAAATGTAAYAGSRLGSKGKEASVNTLEKSVKTASNRTPRQVIKDTAQSAAAGGFLGNLAYGKKGAMTGAALGGLVGGLPGLEKKSSVDLNNVTLKQADTWGRELARAEKAAGVVGSLGETAGRLGKTILKTPASKRALVGAGVGAAADAVTNNSPSIGSMATGAGVGALGGHFAPQGIKALAKHKSEFGKAMKAGLKAKAQ